MNPLIQSFLTSIRPWWNSFLNILYPTVCTCIVCEEALTEEMLQRMGLNEIPDSRVWICKRCRSQVDFIVHVDCVVCGRAYDEHDRSIRFEQDSQTVSKLNQICPECARHNRPFEIARAAIRYKGMGKDLIRIVKFEGRKEPIEWMGEWLRNTWLLYFAQIPFDYIVPVPIQPERLRKRGFNQALLLAEEVSNHTSIPIMEPLLRQGSMRTQASRNRQERLQTLHGVYKGVDSCRDMLQGKLVLLIDDVFTTGATVEACTNELLELGCTGVWVMTLAR